jgi:DNA-directed RNA polymerase subunit RPC12/RpoP
MLNDLPSVTPKERTGKWESTEIFYGGESKGAIIKCSECGNEFKVSPKVFENLYGNERFCNYCGVRMVNE